MSILRAREDADAGVTTVKTQCRRKQVNGGDKHWRGESSSKCWPPETRSGQASRTMWWNRAKLARVDEAEGSSRGRDRDRAGRGRRWL